MDELKLQVHNIDAATEKFNKAITLNPMLIDSYKNLGDLYLHTDEYKEAKGFYKKALLIEKQGEIFFQYTNSGIVFQLLTGTNTPIQQNF